MSPIHVTSEIVCDKAYLFSFKRNIVVLAEKAVAKGVAKPIQDTLQCPLLVFEGGEQIKSRENKAKIEERLLELGCGRDTLLILVGGGAFLDVAGFVAATYCRGVPYVSYPTTLLAMTDASIGGKTAINVPGAKNFIGAFHLPSRVYIALDALKTLPQREFVLALNESIKHALIKDRELFIFIEKNLQKLIQREKEVLKLLVERSAAVKSEIVWRDSKESGERRLLNFGHTVAHALEADANYSLLHGEAVGVGLMVESAISYLSGEFPLTSLNRLFELVGHILPPSTELNTLCFERLIPYINRDKKNANGQIRISFLKEIGMADSFEGEYVSSIAHKTLLEAFSWVNSVWSSQALH